MDLTTTGRTSEVGELVSVREVGERVSVREVEERESDHEVEEGEAVHEVEEGEAVHEVEVPAVLARAGLVVEESRGDLGSDLFVSSLTKTPLQLANLRTIGSIVAPTTSTAGELSARSLCDVVRMVPCI